MKTVGVDLAAEPKGTALAQIEWDAESARLLTLRLGVQDESIVELAKVSDKTGIDCALGWPIEFVEFLNAHSSQTGELNASLGTRDWRRRVSYRETDRVVREVTGRWPLSVATDRLGVTALRAAGLLARLSAAGINTDRSGNEGIVEIYPAASLKLWGFDTAGYRTSEPTRRRLVSDLRAACSWLDLGEHEPLMVSSCDAFDAVVAALAARSAAIGKSSRPSSAQRDQANIEGWIALPFTNIGELISEMIS